MKNKLYIFIIIFSLFALSGCKKKKQTLRELNKKRIALQRPFKNKKIEKLSYDEALKVYEYYKHNEKDYQLIMTIERLVSLATDHTTLEPLLREIADLYYEQGSYKKAEERYATYAQMYPGSKNIDYIQKQQIEASFQQKSIAQRDQTKTKNTIKLARDFLNNFPTSSYRERVQKILNECYFIIMESEINQVIFYISRFNITHYPKALEAAWQRLADLNRDVLPYIDNEHIRAAQEKVRIVLDQEPEHRTLKNLEIAIAPLNQVLRRRTLEAITKHRHPWRNWS
jgi:outer membrane assembly lipoprotein YfiO